MLASSAATAAPPDEALAEALFVEGRRLFQEGQVAEACPKLAESQRLDPAGGTAVLLAACYEREGKTASAWLAYKQALGLATRDHNTDREGLAREAIAALEPKLMSVRLKVAPEVTALVGLVVERDGVTWPLEAWELPLPLDPGEHVIVVKAIGRVDASVRVTLSEPGKVIDALLPMPPLVAPPEPPRPLKTAPIPVVLQPPSRAPMIVALALSGASLALGVGTLADAASKLNAARAACPESPCYNSSAAANQRASRTSADIATVAFSAAAVSAGVGGYLWWVRPSNKTLTAGIGFSGAF